MVRLLVSGFNAHRQLDDSKEDLYNFIEIASNAKSINLATWSTLTWTEENSVMTRGHQNITWPSGEFGKAHSFVGDHNGMLGMLTDCRLWTVHEGLAGDQKWSIQDRTTKRSPRLAHIALANNGRAVAVHDQPGPAEGVFVSEFSTFARLQAWYADPSLPDNEPDIQHALALHVQQIVGGATSFILLTEAGEVYTWGEARRCALGRDIVDENDKGTAHIPGLVTALDGIRIAKVCHGGWMFGALSEDHAAYLWGLDMPQTSAPFSTVAQKSAGEDVALVVIADGNTDEPDIVDMDIGEGHAAVVTSDGQLYVIGENDNGQLGLSMHCGSTSDWTQVPNLHHVARVVCGPNTTAIVATS